MILPDGPACDLWRRVSNHQSGEDVSRRARYFIGGCLRRLYANLIGIDDLAIAYESMDGRIPSCVTKSYGNHLGRLADIVNRERPWIRFNNDHDATDMAATYLARDGGLGEISLLQDIFEGPSLAQLRQLAHPWLTVAVKNLARQIYWESAFDRLPVLADLLEKMGCNYPEMIRHCRGERRCNGVHCQDGRFTGWSSNPWPSSCPNCHGTGYTSIPYSHRRGCWVLYFLTHLE